MSYDSRIQNVIKQTSFKHTPIEDVCVIPFIGGTPSGDALGTTLINTLLSLFY